MSTARKIGPIAVVVVLVKIALYALDRKPAFFLGDSASYLATATDKWFPPDRSFLYGLFIRQLCFLHYQSLKPLVMFQTALGALTCIVLAWCLLSYFRTSLWIALSAAVLFAIEPLEWLSEHYVLTEAFSAFLLALFFWLSFSYVLSNRSWKLILLAPLTFAIVGIRLSNLPLILAFSILLPVLGWKRRTRGALLLVCAHLALSVVAVQSSLLEFRHFNAEKGHLPPALSYANGFFLAGDFSPLIEPEDFPDSTTRQRIFSSLQYPLHDRMMRPVQRWLRGGLVPTIVDDTLDKSGYLDQYAANQLCEATAMHAIRRDPEGLLKLSLLTFGDYWDPQQVRNSLTENMGLAYDFPPLFISTLDRFQFRYEPDKYQRTLSKQWTLALSPWYHVLLLAPLLFVGTFAFIPRANRRIWFLLFVASLIFVVIACTFVEKPTIRYLQPVGWITILGLGAVAQGAQMHWIKINRKVKA